jgi:hypothetical protein
MCRLSRNSGASTSWNPKGLSRPVEGELYLFFFTSVWNSLLRVLWRLFSFGTFVNPCSFRCIDFSFYSLNQLIFPVKTVFRLILNRFVQRLLYVALCHSNVHALRTLHSSLKHLELRLFTPVGNAVCAANVMNAICFRSCVNTWKLLITFVSLKFPQSSGKLEASNITRKRVTDHELCGRAAEGRSSKLVILKPYVLKYSIP